MEEEQTSIDIEQPRGDQPKYQQPEDEHTEIICIESNDHENRFEGLSYVNQKLETIMQRLKQQMAIITAAFVFLGMIFFHSIVQPAIPLRRKWWIPFCIFLSVSIIYWITIKTIIRDYVWVREEYGLTLDHMQRWSTSAGNGMYWMEKSCFASNIISFRQIINLYRQNIYLFVVLMAMSAFNALILYACYSFLHG